jgi:hypothetical protein
MWSYQIKNEQFVNRLGLFFHKAKMENKKIIVLAQLPLLTVDALRAHRFKKLGIPLQVNVDQDYEQANRIIAGIITKFQNVTFLDFSQASIFKKIPFYDGQLIYRDKSHLNQHGSKIYGHFVASKFLNLGQLISKNEFRWQQQEKVLIEAYKDIE